jgi:hypothetical protein
MKPSVTPWKTLLGFDDIVIGAFECRRCLSRPAASDNSIFAATQRSTLAALK